MHVSTKCKMLPFTPTSSESTPIKKMSNNVFLPQETTINILKRLPVKSLKRFQCVCKHWNHLIKTPSFIKKHLHHSTLQNPCLLFQPRRDDQYISHLYSLNTHMQVLHLPTIPPFDASHFSVRDSCNGLLCVEIHKEGIYPPPLVLFNPATRDVLELPCEFDDFKGECYMGFGYSPVVNDYRIVRSYARKGYSIIDMEVYSLSNGLWKREDFMHPMLFHADAVTTNGFMYWPGETFEIGDEGEVIDTSRAVVSYDIASRLFDSVAMPTALGDDSEYELMVYKNKVVIVSYFWDADPSMLELWMMEGHVGGSPFGDSRTWTKIFSILCSAVHLVVPSIFWRDELVYNVCEFSMFVDDETKREAETGLSTVLFLMNIGTSRFNIGVARRCGDWCARIFNYVESLVPVGKITPLLPEEIIRNILVCLPVKSLKRFQCVCKHWRNLIKCQSFISDHLLHSTQNPSLLLQPRRGGKYISQLYSLNREMQVVDLPTKPLFNDSQFRVKGSCNGLLCVEINEKGTYPPNLLLCNPATRDVMMLPRTIDVDFSNWKCYVGFGFSSVVNDYKIVRTYGENQDPVTRVEVYSLSSGSWNEIEMEFDDDVIDIYSTRFISNALTVNGSMFWSGFDLDEFEGDDDVIVSFDIATEEFEFVPMPELSKHSMYQLMVYEDKLAIYDLDRDVEPGWMFHVWVMDEDEWSWSKIFSSHFSTHDYLIPVIFWKGDFVYNVNEVPVLGGEAEGIVTVLFLLNISTNERKVLATRRCGNCNADFFTYTESLVHVGSIPIEESSS